MKATVNLNDKVRFRLTPAGMDCIRQYDATLNDTAKPVGYCFDWFKAHKPDPEGYFSCQLWCLLQMIGPGIAMGTDALIVGNDLEFEGNHRPAKSKPPTGSATLSTKR